MFCYFLRMLLLFVVVLLLLYLLKLFFLLSADRCAVAIPRTVHSIFLLSLYRWDLRYQRSLIWSQVKHFFLPRTISLLLLFLPHAPLPSPIGKSMLLLLLLMLMMICAAKTCVWTKPPFSVWSPSPHQHLNHRTRLLWPCLLFFYHRPTYLPLRVLTSVYLQNLTRPLRPNRWKKIREALAISFLLGSDVCFNR